MFTNEENLTAKTPPGDFQVTTPETPLLSQQVVTSKGIPVPYTNLQLNPYPNTQLDLLCSDSSSFWCTTPKYVTNQLHGSQFNHQLEKVVGCKNLQFIPTMKIKKILGHKTQWCTYTATSLQEWWTKAKLCLRSQFAWTIFAQYFCNLWTLWWPLKKSFYMSRIRRKEDPKIHSRIPRNHNRISVSLNLDK